MSAQKASCVCRSLLQDGDLLDFAFTPARCGSRWQTWYRARMQGFNVVRLNISDQALRTVMMYRVVCHICKVHSASYDTRWPRDCPSQKTSHHKSYQELSTAWIAQQDSLYCAWLYLCTSGIPVCKNRVQLSPAAKKSPDEGW